VNRELTMPLGNIILCLLLFVLSAWCGDFAVCAGGGGVMGIALDKPVTVNAVTIQGKAEVASVQTWDSKTLKPKDATVKSCPMPDGVNIELSAPVQTNGLILSGTNLTWKSLKGIRLTTSEGERTVTLAAPVNPGQKRIPDMTKDMATVLGGKVFFPDPKKPRLTLGSPNKLNRKDRVVIRLDLMDLIGKEKIKQASLHLRFSPYQATYPRQVEVELLNEEQRSITLDTGFGFTTTPLATLLLPFAPKVGVFEISLDVTDAVNKALWKGVASVTCRIRDRHCDQFGNLEKKPYAISIDASQTWLNIQE